MEKIDHLRSIDRKRQWNQMAAVNESLAVAEMGDRVAELDMDWMHPWIGLDWIGLDWIGSNVGKTWVDWIGLRRINDVILCYR